MITNAISNLGVAFEKVSEDNTSSTFRVLSQGAGTIPLDSDPTMIVKSQVVPNGKIRRGNITLKVPLTKDGDLSGEFVKIELSFTGPASLGTYTDTVTSAYGMLSAFCLQTDGTLVEPLEGVMDKIISGQH